ncbi:hypothetical protein Syun_001154 [Stephania yunnanensis]|uniref:Uncharacterized protein n=1 Tax=Stephania yunnanensis TaxID=152371 RepID=A0AAP0Q7G8_9MAGN
MEAFWDSGFADGLVISRWWFRHLNEGKAIVYREEVDDEPTRAQRAAVPG